MAQFFGDTGWAYFLGSRHHMSAAKNREWEKGSFPRRLRHFRRPSKPGRSFSAPDSREQQVIGAHAGPPCDTWGLRGRDLCRGKTLASPRTHPAPQTLPTTVGDRVCPRSDGTACITDLSPAAGGRAT